MRNIYTVLLAVAALPFFFGCSKDILKSYDNRIIGTWKITDINKFGIGGSDSGPFSEGDVFTFEDNGELTHISGSNTYQGSWDIRKELTEEKTVRSLHITAVDFTNQNVRSDFFNEMIFTGTNRFKAYVYSGTKTFVYHFLRQ